MNRYIKYLQKRLTVFFSFVKKNKALFILVIIFGTIYSLISLVNHYNFRTNALDLGLYTNALYDYVHFQWNDSSVFKMQDENLLADHFDLYLIIFSPLSLIFGTYTLLIIQILGILAGGAGVFFYFKHRENGILIPALATLYFYSFFGVLVALAYDYHSNVVAAAMVPWFFYWIQRRKILAASLILLFIIISKENISLWMCFVCLGLFVIHRRDTMLRRYLLAASFFCGIYFITIISVVMPALSNSGSFAHFDYNYLGNSPTEAIVYLISHPIDSFKILFINHHGSTQFDYLKAELHIILLCSGLPFLIWKPQYLLMLIPIYFQKLFHNNPSMWGIGLQYNIEFAPIFAIGIFEFISEIQKPKLKRALAWLAIILVISSTIRIMDSTIYYTKKAKIRFYQKQHYERNYNVSNVHQQLSLLPEKAIICAHSPFLPHLALRNNVYEFPMVKDAEYIVYSDNEDFYINSKEEFESMTDSLKASKHWEILYNGDITILKRNPK